MICPCCGGPMPVDPLRRIEVATLTSKERQIAEFYAERLGLWKHNDFAYARLYADKANGGPTLNTVSVMLAPLNRKLAGVGLKIESMPRQPFRRMMWLT